MDTPRVLVGVDGSPPGTAALRWATTEAAARGVGLTVLVAYRRRSSVAHDAADRENERHASAVVEEAVAAARATVPGVAVDGAAVPGHPVRVLLDASRDADLLVVGSRGVGGFAGLRLGSVGSQVASYASCPLVVVRGRADIATGPVVVGVDGSEPAEMALGTACAEAVMHHAGRVLAVTAYTASVTPWTIALPPSAFDLDKVDADLRRELVGEIARWHEKYPHITIQHEIVQGPAAAALIERSRSARLVVVGTRGLGGFEGMLLGSVGQHLLHDADCPVMIARTVDSSGTLDSSPTGRNES